MLSIVTLGPIQNQANSKQTFPDKLNPFITSKFQQKFGYYEFPNNGSPGPRFQKKEKQVLNQGRKEGDHSLNSQ